MNIFLYYKELLRRYPLARTFSWIFIVVLVIFISTLVGKNVKKEPVILSITPPVGSPGDAIVITGENFGSSRGSSYVEIAGSRVTGSGYIEWTDKKIRLILPSNVQDGLVIVGTGAGKSEPSFFANESGIPVAVKMDPQTTTPTIASITPEIANIGSTVIITGLNFGSSRGSSKILFTANREEQSGEEQNNEMQFIAASENEYDYEFWSDSEIHVRVPDGAASGAVVINTERGRCVSSTKLSVSYPGGKKNYNNRRTYVVQVCADIANKVSPSDASITLYIPRPPLSSFQPVANLSDYYPEPLIKDDLKDIIHQKAFNKILNNNERFSQNFVISTYSVQSNIKGQNIKPYYDTKRLLYSAYTSPDNCIPSGSTEVNSLKYIIIGKERNPYNQAKLIYDYLIDHYKLDKKLRNGSSSPLDLIGKKTGDAYDFTVIFTALCRSTGIPAIPMGGILVEENSVSRCHWWTELYFEDYGWFPVDIALGAGLDFKPFSPVDNVRKYYFGNMDCQHVAFSRGWNQIKPSLINSKTVYRPRTYALQSIWEESGDETSSYSSLWNDPVVIGIY